MTKISPDVAATLVNKLTAIDESTKRIADAMEAIKSGDVLVDSEFLEVQDTPEEAAQLLDWFGKRTELDLKFEHELTFDMIPPTLRSSGTPESAWLVHQEHGGRNDREWTMVAMGQTPLEALREAHKAFCDGR
jgi:hypothetical protein